MTRTELIAALMSDAEVDAVARALAKEDLTPLGRDTIRFWKDYSHGEKGKYVCRAIAAIAALDSFREAHQTTP